MKKIIFLAASALISFQAAAIKPSPHYVVADDYIAPHLVEDHESALVDFKKIVDKSGYKGSWRFYQFDDGRHVAFNNQESHDYQASNDELWEETAEHFSPEFLAENGAVYSRTITNQDFFMMRYLESLSYEPEKLNAEASPAMIWVEINLFRKPVREALAKWVEEQKNSKSPLRFSAYSKQYGADLPMIYMVFHAKSIIEFYQELDKLGTHDPVRLLPKKVLEGIDTYRISTAKYIPEISY